MKRILRSRHFFALTACFLLISYVAMGKYVLIPMDDHQKNHLKAYGITYWALERNLEVMWLLNYRGGSFMMKYVAPVEKECMIRGVTAEIIADTRSTAILNEIANPEANMDVVKLEKPPRIAVYAPKTYQPWDDAVMLVLTYAEIPYDVLYDEEIIEGKLPLYDWLHMHHEDFTGQYGRFYASHGHEKWYKDQVAEFEATAHKMGFEKVSELKLGVALKIRDYLAGGGFLFSMCSGTDSYDIALAAQGVDICASMYDHDAADPQAQQKLDFGKTLAFRNFVLEKNPLVYEFSSIDATKKHLPGHQTTDKFTLFDFSAKWDPIPSMLCQNHRQIIKGFMGQTTDYYRKYVKPEVIIMGENKSMGTVRYIHGEFGKGQWTFYGGHDPEDYQHFVGDPPTDLNLHPDSPGYRLILNNVLFPAARKKKRKT